VVQDNPFPGITPPEEPVGIGITVKRDPTLPSQTLGRVTSQTRAPVVQMPRVDKPFESGVASRLRDKAKVQRQGIPFTLPKSGETVYVRYMSFEFLLRHNLLPTGIQGIVDNVMRGIKLDSSGPQEIDADAMLRQVEITAETYTGFVQLIDAAVLHGFVTPRVYATEAEVEQAIARGDPEAISIEDLDEEDRMAYWSWCQGITEADYQRLATFREQAGEPAPAGDGVQHLEQSPAGLSSGPTP
jgi:hypothetical protein